MKLLVTAFEPFGSHPNNPSMALVAALAEQELGPWQPQTAVLPVSFKRAPRMLSALLKRHQPDRVIAFGLAASRKVLSLERVALNWCDAAIADNDGARPRACALKKRAPAAYFSTLPIDPWLASLDHLGLPSEISLSAGSYLCNAVFFELMHAVQGKPIEAGFIHVPPAECLAPRLIAQRLAQLLTKGNKLPVRKTTSTRPAKTD